MSVTEPTLPSVVATTTVAPPVVRLLLLASLSWTVMVEVVAPSAVIDVGDAVINDVPVTAAPGVNVTVALSVIDDAFRVPVIVAVPVVVAEVNVAV